MEDPPFVGEFAIGNGWKGHVLAYVSFKFTLASPWKSQSISCSFGSL